MEAIVQARAELSKLDETRDDLALARDLPVTSDEEQEFAAATIRWVKELYQGVEAQRRKLTDPLNGVIRDVNDMFRPFREDCLATERVLKGRVAGYLEKKRLANDRAVAEAAAAETAAQAERALSTVRAVEAPRGVSVRYMWVAVIEDASLLPREYLTPNMAKITDAVRDSDGAIRIPGVIAHQESIVSSRRV